MCTSRWQLTTTWLSRFERPHAIPWALSQQPHTVRDGHGVECNADNGYDRVEEDILDVYGPIRSRLEKPIIAGLTRSDQEE